jgi:hypothetical protein
MANKKLQSLASGAALVAGFQVAMTNRATADAAQHMAAQTEQQTMAVLGAIGNQANPIFITPRDITPEIQTELVRASIDAHLKKAQAEQIGSFTSRQLIESEQIIKKRYIGRKVKVGISDREFEPIDTYWLNQRAGRYDTGTIKRGSISGIIEDLSLSKNLIILRPTLKDKVLVPQRKFVVVYIINPVTLEPAVSINIF